ncbi:protein of unknown function (plasmid) [Cupriavidus taiwanensis]|uniref:Uncharacterized protein n=1 Tax=Cupriavidus taiwanensis TaxID=164546 RepID=A0A7Z7JGI2_9BURK|nr:hypothetical protein CBM2598_U60008 [Cupriavidus taiwanensis]SPC26173.1 hypothetical protein CBM2594_U70006 [Cupriavidus taiwanensis]SPD37694.1 protein of unknown function [Cupriavidus taiwanensis]
MNSRFFRKGDFRTSVTPTSLNSNHPEDSTFYFPSEDSGFYFANRSSLLTTITRTDRLGQSKRSTKQCHPLVPIPSP